MHRLVFILMFTFGMMFFNEHIVRAVPFEKNDVINNFVHMYVTKGESEARAFTIPNIEIPEKRESTPIRRFTTLPSPHKDVKVAIGYFTSRKANVDRIAFIWEVKTNRNKISDIRVVYDGANPFVDEAKIINEYESKMKTRVLVPSEFPFDITRIDSYIDQDALMLRYRNNDIQGLVQIKVVPSNIPLVKLKGNQDDFLNLENGSKAVYQPDFPPARQLIFQHEGLRYTIGIGRRTKMDIKKDDLLKVANSMF